MNDHTISPEEYKKLTKKAQKLDEFLEKLQTHISDKESDVVTIGELTLTHFNLWG